MLLRSKSFSTSADSHDNGCRPYGWDSDTGVSYTAPWDDHFRRDAHNFIRSDSMLNSSKDDTVFLCFILIESSIKTYLAVLLDSSNACSATIECHILFIMQVIKEIGKWISHSMGDLYPNCGTPCTHLQSHIHASIHSLSTPPTVVVSRANF